MGIETATAIALGISAAATAGATGYGIYSGIEGSNRQGQALDQQTQAQSAAAAAAKKQQRTSEEAVNKANQQQPDLNSILANASKASGGAASTLLTGVGGVDPNKLTLGKSSLLGS